MTWMYPDEEWAARTYDEIVKNSEDAIKLAEARDQWIQAYIDQVESGYLTAPTLQAQGAGMFAQLVKPIRTRRRSSFKDDLRGILEAITDGTILGQEDPILQMAYAIGDGTDRTLAFWTVDDFRTASMERYRNSAAVVAAARDFDEITSQLIDAMISRGARKVADL